MIIDSCIITKTNEEVVFIGEQTLKYLKKNSQNPYFYLPGRLENGDVAVVFSNTYRKYEIDLHEFGISKNEINYTDNFIAIGTYHADGITGVVKEDIDLENEEDMLIDIVYNGKSINIKQQDGKVIVNIDEEMLRYNLYDIEEFVILINSRGIKYYSTELNFVNGQINPVFKAKEFEGYYNKRLLKNMKLKNILEDDVYFDLKNNSITESNNERICVTRKNIEFNEEKYNVYSLRSKEQLYQDLIEENCKLKELEDNYYKNEYKGMQFNSFRLLGNGEKIDGLETMLQKGSSTNATILLTGESGTGKTFLAKEIHNASNRNDMPFVHINCAAIPYQLLESELFGYEDGAFTGAKKGGKVGLIERADHGTLFLDEIGEIPLALQGKLLEVMQSKTYCRVGGTRKYKANVRFIVATNRDLKTMVKERTFREDLFYRINVFPIEIPPLRERIHAIHGIISCILPEICANLEMEPVLIDFHALRKIKKYSWPGNIRELENILEKAVILCDRKIIMEEDIVLPKIVDTTLTLQTLKDVKEEAEKQAIINALKLFNGDKIKAATYLDIGRTAIFDKIKKYNIN